MRRQWRGAPKQNRTGDWSQNNHKSNRDSKRSKPMAEGQSNTINLTHVLRGLAAAVERSPNDVKSIHEGLISTRAEGLGALEQAVRLAGDPDIKAAVRSLRSEADVRAHALARDGKDDDDEYEIDWGEVLFIAIMIVAG
jgi:hypothetical protein